MWLRFLERFDFNPAEKRGRVTMAYKADQVANVTTECARLAIAAGKAKRTVAPRQGSTDNGRDDRGG